MCQYSVSYGEYENKKKTGQKKLAFPDGQPTELTVFKKSGLYCIHSGIVGGWVGAK